MQLVAPRVGLLCTSALVGGTIPIAVGAALASKIDGSNRVAVIVFGDGGTEEGVFHESMNFASMKKLPVVFVCENNFYAVYTHQSARQCADNIYQRAASYLIPGVRIDGNDVLRVYNEAKKAVDRARRGEGPTLIECRTYRWLEHVGPHSDTHLGYRSEAVLQDWKARCPVQSFKHKLVAEGALSEKETEEIKAEIINEIEEAVAYAKKSPYPDVEELGTAVYAP